MKIKMLTLMAGPGGVRQPGKVYDVSPDEAAALIKAGSAEEVKAKAGPDPVPAAPRTAARKSGRTADKPDAGVEPSTTTDPKEPQA